MKLRYSIVALCLIMGCDDRTPVQYMGKEYRVKTKSIALNDTAVQTVIHKPDSIHYAIKLLGEAIGIDSDNYRPYYNKIAYESPFSEYKYGLETIEALVNHFPASAQLYLKLGLVQEKNGLIDQAKANFNRSLRLTKDKIHTSEESKDSVNLDLAVLTYLIGDTVLGIKFYDSYKLSHPNSPIVKDRNLKDIINQLKAPDEFADSVQKMLGEEPKGNYERAVQ